MTKAISEFVEWNLKNIGIVTRPNADNGLWLSLLLTGCFTVNMWNQDQQIDLTYKRMTILCFGLFFHSFCIFLYLYHRKAENGIGKYVYCAISMSLTFSLFQVYLKDNRILSLISTLFGVISYDRIFFLALKKMPRCFTLGEASVVSQGVVLFLYNTFLAVPAAFLHEKSPNETTSELHLIVQIILLGTGMMIISCHFILLLRYSICFWMLFLIVTTGAMLFPLHGKPTLQILLQFVFSDMQRILLVALYLTLLSIASIFVLWQMKQHGNANTAFRKVFHVLILLVYFPGLLCQCNLLYVASGGMLALLFLLETARIIKLNPLHEMLEAAVRCFVDDKDTGVVALTPIYLLVGCSLPMWLHPVPCDLTDSAGLNMIKLSAGVLSVGIGDTFASVCGYYIGKHKWPGSTKSVEGTLANAIAQLSVVFGLLKLRLIHLTVSKAAITGSAIITNVIVEAKTNQVDNLVLPLVTYIILGIV